MNKILVAVFDTESAAFEGLSALKDLHRDGDVTLYATVVLTKDSAGKVSVKQAAEAGPAGTAVGLFAGSLVGLLGGPVGVAIGASLGSLTGLVFDLRRAGLDLDFVNELSATLMPGKAAVLADIQETWTVPVDTRLGKLGAVVFRRSRSEMIEDQLSREAAALDAELKQGKDELAQAGADAKAEVQKRIDTAKRKIEATEAQAKATLDHAKAETDAKLGVLQSQLKAAGERQAAKIEQRIADAKASYEARRGKLDAAWRLARQALT